ncbi:MAG: hypothetical protein IJ309_06525 [Clostridia bacterium]|nr:hypothetical protein [Clostridia bacterium]
MRSRKWVILITSKWGNYGYVQSYGGCGRMTLVNHPKNAKWFWTENSASVLAREMDGCYGNHAEVVEYFG